MAAKVALLNQKGKQINVYSSAYHFSLFPPTNSGRIEHKV